LRRILAKISPFLNKTLLNNFNASGVFVAKNILSIHGVGIFVGNDSGHSSWGCDSMFHNNIGVGLRVVLGWLTWRGVCSGWLFGLFVGFLIGCF
jgi:hypothetical protein